MAKHGGCGKSTYNYKPSKTKRCVCPKCKTVHFYIEDEVV